jgi:hypothetical protein
MNESDSARTFRALPLRLGNKEGVTDDYDWHGATTLFVAIDVANGEVFTRRVRRPHSGQT